MHPQIGDVATHDPRSATDHCAARAVDVARHADHCNHKGNAAQDRAPRRTRCILRSETWRRTIPEARLIIAPHEPSMSHVTQITATTKGMQLKIARLDEPDASSDRRRGDARSPKRD